MAALALAAAFFLAIHLLISGTPVRGAVVRIIGEGPYMGLFSLLSLVGLWWLVSSYGPAVQENVIFWGSHTVTRVLAVPLQFAAFLLVVVGLLTRNPTAVMQTAAVDDTPKGVLRVTRHPFLWGVAIFSFGHLVNNGDAANFLFFGSLFALSLLGTVSIDRKRQAALGERWERFAMKTSNVPFAAIIDGRNRFVAEEFNLLHVTVAVSLFFATLALHEILFGAPPL